MNRTANYFLKETLITNLSPLTSTTLQKVRSPLRLKSSETRLPPMFRLRIRRKSSQSGSIGLIMFNSLRGADGRIPSSDVSNRKNAPDAHACGEHETG